MPPIVLIMRDVLRVLRDVLGALCGFKQEINLLRRDIAELRIEGRDARAESNERLSAVRMSLAASIKNENQILNELAVQAGVLDRILHAVVGRPVAKVVLYVDGKEAVSPMNINKKQTSILSFQCFDKDGQPTTPLAAPVFSQDEGADFSLVPSDDNQSAVLSLVGASGSVDNVKVTIDGVDSNMIEFDAVDVPPNPVAKVVLIASTPA